MANKINSKYINKNFRIKVYGLGLNTLLGVSGALDLIGADLLIKFIHRTERSGRDKVDNKLRRGLKVTIYVK